MTKVLYVNIYRNLIYVFRANYNLVLRIILRLFFMYINNNLRKFIGGRLIYEKG